MIRLGNKVFYCDNATDRVSYTKVADSTIRAAGLVPIWYQGTGTRIGHLQREAKLDIVQCKVVVVRLGLPEPLNNWALSNVDEGVPLLIYANLFIEKSLPVPPVVVANEREFGAALKRDLEALLQ